MKTRTFAVAAALLAATATLASASTRDREHDREHEHEHDRDRDHHSRDETGRATGPVDPTYAKECGACHVAYPPRFLPATSWRRIMAGLDDHFRENAELEPEARAAVERWLVERAAPARASAAAEPSLRITEQSWFGREHDEVPQGAVARASIRSLANCSACHPGAERWDFDEDRVKIPPR